MWEAVGLTVSRLMRVRFGPIVLGSGVRVGRSRELSREEIRQLQQAAGVEVTEPLQLDTSREGRRAPSRRKKIRYKSSGRNGRSS